MSYEKVSVYRCKCDKCFHEWTAKADILPVRCAKCNVTTWNNGLSNTPNTTKALVTTKRPIKQPVAASIEPESITDNSELTYDFDLLD